MMAHIGVFIVYKNEVVRLGLRQVLKSEQYIDILGDCANPMEALSQIKSLYPDVVLMGIEPGIEGIEATRVLKKVAKHDADVIILAERTDYVFQAMEAGAAGYLLKDISGTELASAIREVYCIGHPEEERETIVELVIPPPVDAGRILRFIEKLESLDAIVTQTVGSADRGTLITILTKYEISTLLEELRDMPDVEKVEEKPLTFFNSFRKVENLYGLRTARRRMLVTLETTAGA